MSTTMIDVKEAVQSASKYFNELQNIFGLMKAEDLRLEEVEISDDRSQWLITLGYRIDEDRLGMRSKREYKIFTVDSTNGEVKSMKIREV